MNMFCLYLLNFFVQKGDRKQLEDLLNARFVLSYSTNISWQDSLNMTIFELNFVLEKLNDQIQREKSALKRHGK